jgi:hypothetical protein
MELVTVSCLSGRPHNPSNDLKELSPDHRRLRVGAQNTGQMPNNVSATKGKP